MCQRSLSPLLVAFLLVAAAPCAPGGSFAHAQPTAPPRNPPPALMVKEAAASEPLALQRLAVDTRILGFLAETRMTLTFANPYDRALTGDLYFPLPEGATISGYALDVGGVMVEGVVVGKDEDLRALRPAPYRQCSPRQRRSVLLLPLRKQELLNVRQRDTQT